MFNNVQVEYSVLVELASLTPTRSRQDGFVGRSLTTLLVELTVSELNTNSLSSLTVSN
jgi:hypothetical protein